jgi:hypothetical protein
MWALQLGESQQDESVWWVSGGGCGGGGGLVCRRQQAQVGEMRTKRMLASC